MLFDLADKIVHMLLNSGFLFLEGTHSKCGLQLASNVTMDIGVSFGCDAGLLFANLLKASLCKRLAIFDGTGMNVCRR